MSQLFPSVFSRFSYMDTLTDSLSPPTLICFTGVSPSAQSAEIRNTVPSVVDSISCLGLLELPRLSSFDSHSLNLLGKIEHFVFKSPHASEEPYLPCLGDYILTELLNQANPDFLRQCLYHLLQDKEIQFVNPTRVLEFIQSVLTLPRITYPVPRSEPRDRPDAFAALKELVQLNMSEALHLIYYVLLEACSILSCSNLASLDRLLLKRIPLLDLAVIPWSLECLSYVQFVAGFIDASHIQRSLYNVQHNSYMFFSSKNDSRLSVASRRLLVHLYFRWPGLIFTFSPTSINYLFDYCKTDSTVHSRPEIDRLGTLLLIGMACTNTSVCETAYAASQTLAVYHPWAFISLLPVLSALTEGYLDRSRTQFSTKSLHKIFENILHLLELISSPNLPGAFGQVVGKEIVTCGYVPSLFGETVAFYSDNIHRQVMNLLTVLTRFYGSTKRLGGFPVRLFELLQRYGRWTSRPRDSMLNSTELCTMYYELRKSVDFFLPRLDAKASNCSDGCQQIETNRHGAEEKPWIFDVSSSPFDTEASRASSILEVLEGLDEASKQRIDILSQYKMRLLSLLAQPNEDVSGAALKLLLRLLSHCPYFSGSIIQSHILPILAIERNANHAFTVNLMHAIPDLCLLAPTFAPQLLRICAERYLFSSVPGNSFIYADAVENSVRRLTLDGLDDAVIEHVASALSSQTNMIHEI